MAKTKTLPYDTADYLTTIEHITGYLEAVLEDGNPELVAAALGDIARSKGMTHLARVTGLGRESLYKALSPTGNPELATVLKVIRALGMTLTVKPMPVRPKTRRRIKPPQVAAAATGRVRP